ncbi:GLPGLI family protein [Chryseobacterium taihuense]|uniref:GLPGLI family protein n=2 Tax=Chryseobacterium taihuense TaxID=1141221 RepID=A0ABY0R0A5_9FLAO|nr:GLPGLI family protein [Chryseobacterium taihuense]
MRMFSILLILVSATVVAQTHRFIYEYHYKTDSTSSEHRKTNMVLDVNPADVKFYNYEFVKTDSANITKGGNHIIWDDTPVVVRKRNTNINNNYINLQNMFIVETEDRVQWKLSNETKTSGSYQLQKATTGFGGRNWTAWFTKDINLNEGPYKFRGLPGLIFELYDDKDQFKFSLIKSYQLSKTYETRNIIENFAGQKPVKIPESRLNKMIVENFNDPLREFKEHYKNNTDPTARFMVMGIEVKSPEQIKDLSDKLQSHLRKHNNPIELNKAIVYPEK